MKTNFPGLQFLTGALASCTSPLLWWGLNWSKQVIFMCLTKGIDIWKMLGYALYNNIDVEQGEDTMITGVLRDAIGDIEVVREI